MRSKPDLRKFSDLQLTSSIMRTDFLPTPSSSSTVLPPGQSDIDWHSPSLDCCCMPARHPCSDTRCLNYTHRTESERTGATETRKHCRLWKLSILILKLGNIDMDAEGICLVRNRIVRHRKPSTPKSKATCQRRRSLDDARLSNASP